MRADAATHDDNRVELSAPPFSPRDKTRKAVKIAYRKPGWALWRNRKSCQARGVMEDRAARYPRLGLGHEERGEQASPILNRLPGRLLLLDEGSLLLILSHICWPCCC